MAEIDGVGPDPAETEPEHNTQSSESTVTRSTTGSTFVVAPPKQSFSKRFGSVLISAILLGILFFGIPTLVNLIDFPPQSKPFLAVLVLINPITVFIINAVYSSFWRYGLMVVALSALIAIPSFYVFYNDSALIYAVFYAVVALLGWAMGKLLSLTKNRSAR